MQPEASNVDVGFGEVSKKWMIAALGVIPVLLQAASYLYFKAFFRHFQVRPEEVGYDFSSLLGRQAAATIFASAICLIGLALISGLVVYVFYPMSLAYFGSLAFPASVKRRFPVLAKFEGDFVDLRIAGVLGVYVLIAGGIFKFNGGSLRFLLIPTIVLVFALDHLASRRHGRAVPSAWDRFTASRSYGVGRVAALLVAFSCFLSVIDTPVGSFSWLNVALFFAVLVLLTDRMFCPPRVEISDVAPSAKALPALVFSVISVLGAAGIFVMGIMDEGAKMPVVRHAVTDTYVGKGYAAGAFDWKSIVVPDTFPVSVFWSNTSTPPSSLSEGKSTSAVLLGQEGGVTVLWLPQEKTPIRVPSASISMVSR